MMRLGGLLVAIALLAGCSGGGNSAGQPALGGPLKIGGDSVVLCIPAAEKKRDFTYGFDALSNGGSHDLTIDTVTLIGPINAGIAEAFLVPITKRSLFGARSTWPPPLRPGSSAQEDWAKRVVAAGATVPAKAEDQSADLNLVLHITRDDDSREAGFDAVQIDYKADGRVYRVSTTAKLKMRAKCS